MWQRPEAWISTRTSSGCIASSSTSRSANLPLSPGTTRAVVVRDILRVYNARYSSEKKIDFCLRSENRAKRVFFKLNNNPPEVAPDMPRAAFPIPANRVDHSSSLLKPNNDNQTSCSLTPLYPSNPPEVGAGTGRSGGGRAPGHAPFTPQAYFSPHGAPFPAGVHPGLAPGSLAEPRGWGGVRGRLGGRCGDGIEVGYL